MRRRALLALLLLASPLAGCADGGGGDAQVLPTDDDDGTSTPGGSRGTFVVEHVRLTTADGRDRTPREDDVLTLGFRVRVPADASETTGFVTVLVNGEVVESRNLRLQPGQSRDFEHRLEDLRGLDAVEAEVRALAGHGTARADVLAWPRVGEYEGIDGLGVVVHRWAPDEANGTVVVNASFVSEGPAFSTLRAKLLCVDAGGAVDESEPVEPGVPQPGQPQVDAEMAFPRCGEGEAPYGLQASARDAMSDPAVHARVLFVPDGWAPAAQA